MLNRRTAARREWSVWWRYAVVLLAATVLTLLVLAFRGAPSLFGAAVFYLALYGAAQLVVLGIATAAMVRYRVRTYHVWIGAAGCNAPIVLSAMIPFGYWLILYTLGVLGAIAWAITVSRLSYTLADPRWGYLCRACFYDLRGLSGPVCPECGTPTGSTAPAASAQPHFPAASP